MKVGKFITLEGGEGAGKSTQLTNIKEFLISKGIDVITTREPGGSAGGEAIRSLHVLGDPDRWDAVSEALLMNAARRDHIVRLIRPAMESGKWVVCDRYADSTLAYQGYAGGVAIEKLNALYDFISDGLSPDLTVVFDIDPEVGISRSFGRSNNETRFEQKNMEFHQKIRQGFLKIASENSQRCKVVDASQKQDIIKQELLDLITKKFDL